MMKDLSKIYHESLKLNNKKTNSLKNVKTLTDASPKKIQMANTLKCSTPYVIGEMKSKMAEVSPHTYQNG